MIGIELREIRERRGFTVRELAEQASLSAEAISAIERGTRYPSLSTLETLANCLRVNIVIGPDETIIEPE